MLLHWIYKKRQRSIFICVPIPTRKPFVYHKLLSANCFRAVLPLRIYARNVLFSIYCIYVHMHNVGIMKQRTTTAVRYQPQSLCPLCVLCSWHCILFECILCFQIHKIWLNTTSFLFKTTGSKVSSNHKI